jgi:hypothetical protein
MQHLMQSEFIFIKMLEKGSRKFDERDENAKTRGAELLFYFPNKMNISPSCFNIHINNLNFLASLGRASAVSFIKNA